MGGISWKKNFYGNKQMKINKKSAPRNEALLINYALDQLKIYLNPNCILHTSFTLAVGV
jgi:hypothetical protein